MFYFPLTIPSTHTLTFIILHFLFELHAVLLNLLLLPQEISFINVLASLVLVIIIKTLKLTSSVSLGTNFFVDKSSIVLQLPLHLKLVSAIFY